MDALRGVVITLVVSCIVLVACSKPYDAPAFDAGGSELPASDPAARFEGLAAHIGRQGPARVLWTHGMCTHSFSWVTRTSRLLRAALMATVGEATERPETDGTYTVTTSISTLGGDLQTRFFVWSPATLALKDRLLYDNSTGFGARFEYGRAGLNELLKRTLMNDCLADAVIVAGPNRAQIYEDARSAVCQFLGGVFTKPVTCRFVGDETPPIPRSIVAESLGSKIIADAVLDLKAAPGEEDIFHARLSTIRQIYLVANQIPLLDLADALPAGVTAGDGPDFTGSLATMLRRIQPEDGVPRRDAVIQVVAFTDPNDLLSYRLIERQIDPNRATLVNVIVSNDWTFFPFSETFALERPDTAHCDYRRNSDVLAMIAVGNPGFDGTSWQQVSDRLEADEPKGCGF